jgi:hypothetical protein
MAAHQTTEHSEANKLRSLVASDLWAEPEDETHREGLAWAQRFLMELADKLEQQETK